MQLWMEEDIWKWVPCVILLYIMNPGGKSSEEDGQRGWERLSCSPGWGFAWGEVGDCFVMWCCKGEVSKFTSVIVPPCRVAMLR